MDYNLLKVFTKVAELGSFTQAAKVLNQPKSRVSRAIARLEDELGIQLIRRTTRKTSLTSIGLEFYQNVLPLMVGLNDELIRVSNFQEEMSGVIRITAPGDLAQTLVADVVSDYSSKFPKVEIQTIVTNEFLDLTKENIDLCIRAGKLADSSLIQKKLFDVSFIVVCSKTYQDNYGAVTTIDDLKKHKFLSFKGMEKEYFSTKSKNSSSITPTIVSDSISMLLSMVLNNNGISILPDYFCKSHIQAGTLVQLLSTLKTKKENVHLLYTPSAKSSLKVKRFIETVSSFIN